jgi:hypothetical protein
VDLEVPRSSRGGGTSINSIGYGCIRQRIFELFRQGNASTFEAEFPVVTGRTVQMIEFDHEPPDRVALINGMETGFEF